ncbi:hypothetical protein [Clostridium ganghwense]|uniref:Uncharacterized protein n=1 Tax=Clostridium ganghwense TaxID=312089 RepID=A0ABT4CJ83_9CLOT|nr:hypothetical protein [Clostridium ganghwense]MCY6369109.1 hypothetical protein [Clostridium ganghwense]
MNHKQNHLERHPYITGNEKIYESKEVEIAREAEVENVKNTFEDMNKKYNTERENIEHKYGHDSY